MNARLERCAALLPRIDELDTDPEGAQLGGIDAARREAILAAREMLAKAIGRP